MLEYQILLPQQYKSMPWKNGLGTTLEIERYDDKNGLCFRISQASVVEDGIFSDFSHLQRTLVLLSGQGITLEHSHQQQDHSASDVHELTRPLDMAHFDGGDKTLATLHDGGIEDLNIMVRKTDTTAKVTVMKLGRTLVISGSNQRLFSAYYANSDCNLHLKTSNGNAYVVELPKNSLLRLKVEPWLTNSFNSKSAAPLSDTSTSNNITSTTVTAKIVTTKTLTTLTVTKGAGVFIDITSLTD
ncbi:HutD/Ves family protein [Psychromonas arctica]|uniref:HutD/Ves family protein n=1 Tax=Psychromonas arctica TaxID=168275 RepID=UPI00041FEEB9|nr:HutD family protein [Psychromonas arctica]